MLNSFFHYCKEVDCQIVVFVTLNDGQVRQKMTKKSLNTKAGSTDHRINFFSVPSDQSV